MALTSGPKSLRSVSTSATENDTMYLLLLLVLKFLGDHRSLSNVIFVVSVSFILHDLLSPCKNVVLLPTTGPVHR